MGFLLVSFKITAYARAGNILHVRDNDCREHTHTRAHTLSHIASDKSLHIKTAFRFNTTPPTRPIMVPPEERQTSQASASRGRPRPHLRVQRMGRWMKCGAAVCSLFGPALGVVQLAKWWLIAGRSVKTHQAARHPDFYYFGLF